MRVPTDSTPCQHFPPTPVATANVPILPPCCAGRQAFGCYVHMSVIRLFVESILRYGLPPQFQAAVVKPLPKMEVRLRTVLASAFGTGAAKHHGQVP